MATTVNDQHNVTYEQSRRAGYAFVTARFVQDFIEVVYRFGAGATSGEFGEPNNAWQLGLRTEYSKPRVMVRIGERTLYEAARDTLQVLGYEVRDKGDHMVVMI